MQGPQDLILFSDLHLAPERGRGLFRADTQLADFLRWIDEEAGPARVVIAGDFLDFLVPGEGEETVPAFDPKGAAARTSRIVENHPEAFDGLARLACSPRHELWILGGNHDPEMLFADVQETLERRLINRFRRSSLRLRVEGEAVRFRVGEAAVLVAHGDLFDNWNRIDHASLRRAANRLSFGFLSPKEHGYEPPLGTRLVVEFVLQLRDRYPWIDALKPEREAVFPILHQFLDPSERPAFRRLLKYALMNLGESFLSELVRRHSPSRLVRGEGERIFSPRQRLERWLQEEGATVQAPRPDDFPGSLIRKLRQASAEDSYFHLFTPDASAQRVPLLFDLGADVVILGHTHSAKACILENGLYLNSGAWSRLLRLPESETTADEWQTFLAALHAGADLGQVRPTFVQVTHEQNGRGTLAALMEWENESAITRALFGFTVPDRRWVREA